MATQLQLDHRRAGASPHASSTPPYVARFLDFSPMSILLVRLAWSPRLDEANGLDVDDLQSHQCTRSHLNSPSPHQEPLLLVLPSILPAASMSSSTRSWQSLVLLLLLLVATSFVARSVAEIGSDPREVGATEALDIAVPVGAAHEDLISYEFASYIAVHFADFDLPEGDSVVISSPDSAIATTHTYTGRGRDGRSTFIASFVAGNSVSVQYNSVNRTADNSKTAYRITGYSRGLPSRDFESVCGAGDQSWPALCFASGSNLSALPLAYERAKAVARLLINGSWICTGFLAGTGGHVFTNAHCYDSDDYALSTDFEFGSESSSCSDLCEQQLGCPGTVVATSAKLLARNTDIDYALLQLPEDIDTSAFGYLQFRESGPVEGEAVYVPQYPMGYAKRIASATDDGSSSSIEGLHEDNECGANQVEHDADTESGASGSPVIAAGDNTVVAIHHCGGCNNMAIDVRDVVADLQNRSISIPDLFASKSAAYGTVTPVDTSVDEESSDFDDPTSAPSTTASPWSSSSDGSSSYATPASTPPAAPSTTPTSATSQQKGQKPTPAPTSATTGKPTTSASSTTSSTTPAPTTLEPAKPSASGISAYDQPGPSPVSTPATTSKNHDDKPKSTSANAPATTTTYERNRHKPTPTPTHKRTPTPKHKRTPTPTHKSESTSVSKAPCMSTPSTSSTPMPHDREPTPAPTSPSTTGKPSSSKPTPTSSTPYIASTPAATTTTPSTENPHDHKPMPASPPPAMPAATTTEKPHRPTPTSASTPQPASTMAKPARTPAPTRKSPTIISRRQRQLYRTRLRPLADLLTVSRRLLQRHLRQLRSPP